jgi:chromosome segregation ATPase
VDERTIALARELERRDAELAAAIAEVDEHQRAVEELRSRTAAVAGLLASLPRERETAASARARAVEELEARRRDVSRAEAELGQAKGARREAAQRALERARDAVDLGEGRLARARADSERLDSEAASAEAEAAALELRARRLSERLSTLPRLARQAAERPRPGLDGTTGWAAAARAALWVVRSGLDTERERVVREANELGASVFGEPLAATSVAGVRERLERVRG